jgi:catalase
VIDGFSKIAPPSANIMGRMGIPFAILALQGLVSAAGCPFADPANLVARAADAPQTPVSGAIVDDSNGFLTDDVGGQIGDQDSLRAGERGPTLLEDFIFRQKITHFDHERVSSLIPFTPF